MKRFHSFLKITKDLVPIIKQLKSDIANPRSFPSHFLKRISVASGADNNFFQKSTMGCGLDNKRDRGGSGEGAKEHLITLGIANTFDIVRDTPTRPKPFVDFGYWQ